MTLAPGVRLGPYEIVGHLGAGGMGEVYRARDTRLGRDVAVKVLPEGFERDPERVTRFEREAKLLASMNHPNIAMLYGVEQHGDMLCLALELIEGESLAERLKRGPLALDEAFDVAAQVATALEAGHEAGVVHRDLKPGNVMLRPDGVAKVLDVGLARGQGSAGGPHSDMTQSPTMTSPATMPGVILGTAAYMSPEQAKGRRADRRADLWAWGCLLYELITGDRAFPGEDVSETMAAILKSEPDWTALPAGVSPRLRELLERCLRKDPRERLRDAGDARLLLAEARAHVEAIVPVTRTRGARTWLWAVALAIVAASLGLIALLRPSDPSFGPAALTLLAPDGVRLGGDCYDIAVSPDGHSVVFVAKDTTGNESLWLRPLRRDDARPLPGTRAGSQPFWSPDSRRIGFFAEGKLKTLLLATGSVEVLCDAPQPRGGAWGRGSIVLQPRSMGPLMRIPERGGVLIATTVLDTLGKDRGHRFPCFLPDGQHFIYSILGGRRMQGDTDSFILAVGSLDGARGRDVTGAAGGAVFAAPGYLLFVSGDALRAQRFDPRSYKLSGPALAIPGLKALSPDAAGAPAVTASATGVVVQWALEDRARQSEWLDRQGHSLGVVPAPEGIYRGGQISPDGKRVAFEFGLDSNASPMIWLLELARGTMQRMTYDGMNSSPVWSPDGRVIAFTRTTSGGPGSLWTMRADSPGSQQAATPIPFGFNTLLQYTPDGTAIVYRTQGLDTQQDLMMVTLGDSTPVRALLQTRFNELQGSVSPDGHWLAYLSDESGRLEVYARNFPDLGGQLRVSTDGAYAHPTSQNLLGRPAWKRDMRELLFIAADGRTVMAAAVDPGDPPVFGKPRALFRLPASVVDLYPTRDLDRFLVEKVPEEEGRSEATALINWWGLLESTK
ncbi:MAG: protein kinase [Candidatus Eisenbacteria bacterium]